MRNMSYVVTIKEKIPIEGKDKIVIYSFEENGYNVIGSKNDFNVGDLGVYFEVDSLLPIKPEFEFLRQRCFHNKTGKFRIKNLKLCGIYSNGLLMTFEQCKIKSRKAGTDLTKILSVGKYESEEDASPKKKTFFDFLMKIKWLRPILKKLFLHTNEASRYFPVYLIEKSDEVNIQNMNRLWNPLMDCYIGIKIEGQGHTCLINPSTKKFESYSRNTAANLEQRTFDHNFNIEKKLLKALKKTGDCFAVQGEFTSPQVQRGIYKNGTHFYVYTVKNISNNYILSYSELIDFCKKYEFETVPMIYQGILGDKFNSITEMQEFTEHLWFKVGLDNINVINDLEKHNEKISKENGYHRHEGIVVRSCDQKVSYKVKSNEYALAGL